MEGRTMIQEDKEAMTTDPIFAAIAAHRSAWVAVMAAMDRADEPLAREQGRIVTPADIDAKERADRALDDAMEALKQTRPVTMAGLKAAIAYLIEWDERQMGDDARDGIQALLRTPLFEVKPRKNVAWQVLFDLEEDIRNVRGISQIFRALVQHNAESDIVEAAVHFATSMAFDLEKKYDEAFAKARAARQAEEQIEP
jgi:hypothetical protein